VAIGNMDRLVKDLSELLQAGTESGDLTRLIDAAVPCLTRDQAGTLTQDSRDITTSELAVPLSVLVNVHWVRYQLLPEGQDQDDLQAYLKWSAALLPVASHIAPSWSEPT
jgi:hypothetical protein